MPQQYNDSGTLTILYDAWLQASTAM